MRKLEHIQWLDHCSENADEWTPLARVQRIEPSMIDTVGYVIEEVDNHIVVAQSISDDDMVLGNVCILKSDIVQRRPLRVR